MYGARCRLRRPEWQAQHGTDTLSSMGGAAQLVPFARPGSRIDPLLGDVGLPWIHVRAAVSERRARD